MGGLVRCVECGEVHWNLSLGGKPVESSECRMCGSELQPERRRPGRRFPQVLRERRDAPLPGKAVQPGS